MVIQGMELHTTHSTARLSNGATNNTLKHNPTKQTTPAEGYNVYCSKAALSTHTYTTRQQTHSKLSRTLANSPRGAGSSTI